MYDFNLLLLLPVGLVFYGAVTGKPPLTTMNFGGALALALGVGLHSMRVADGFEAEVLLPARRRTLIP